MVLKLELASDSPERFVKTYTAEPHPKVSASISLG
jgi:hypothetical protein